ncbi:DNA-deoxyinosine glycosylase [Anaerolentibacter hominis]|uniref:DNA-deoxyinosine glycosylase n=1 Tax=Anaerolentibacter hominis TaxID=3079009 RepID=UPI0031B84D1B
MKKSENGIRTLVEHEIEPVWDADSRVLILGTMPSPKSRETGFFYGHPRNRFWKVMAAVYGEPELTTIEEKKDFLVRKHLALWDVLKTCEITGASDSSIRNPVPNDFTTLFQTASIRQVFATGAAAADLYRKLSACANEYPIIKLPSTSPANCQAGFDDLVSAYRQIRAVADAESGIGQ